MNRHPSALVARTLQFCRLRIEAWARRPPKADFVCACEKATEVSKAACNYVIRNQQMGRRVFGGARWEPASPGPQMAGAAGSPPVAALHGWCNINTES